MITAKDIFIIEQEMIQEAQYLMNNASLSPEEIEDINEILPTISEREWENLHKTLVDKQTDPLTKIKNGELLKVIDINIAVYKACKNE